MNERFFLYGVLVACLGIHSPPAIAATPITDEDWTALNPNQNPGTNNAVTHLVSMTGKLFMAGSFTKVGDTTISGIVVFDGNPIRSIGGGNIQEMSAAKDGSIYAAGAQDTAGGRPPFGVRKWDGAAWTSLGTGFDAGFTDIEAGADGIVYAAGAFTMAGGVPAANIAKWDGNAWTAVNWTGGYTISEVCVSPKGALYVTGTFRGGIAKFADTAWQIVGSGLSIKTPAGTTPRALEVRSILADANENLYVAGAFDLANLVPVQNVAKWNGAAWESLGGGLTGTIQRLVQDGSGKIYAGGTNSILSQWDGTKWNRIGNGSGAITALACDEKGRVYIGGSFSEFNRIVFGNLAAWDGTGWFSPIRSINGIIRALTSDSKGNIYAGGFFTLAGGVGANHVAKWDGKEWSALGTGITNEGLENDAIVIALATDENDNLYAAGNFTKAGGIAAKNIARWNGTRWDSLGKGMNESVYGLTHDRRGTLFAIGGFDSAGDFSVEGAARWNNGDWYPVQAGRKTINNATALGSDKQGNVYASGRFFNGSVWEWNIGLWKNDEWTVISAGSNTDVRIHSIVCDNGGNLYTGGVFKSIEGAGVNVGRWNGKVWYPLGDGLPIVPNEVFLATDARGNVYATGDWAPRTQGTTSRNLAKWNGLGWEPLGSGVDDGPLALVSIDSTLYVAGSFTRAGKKYSPRFAKVNIHNSENSTAIPARSIRASAAPEWKVIHAALFLTHIEAGDRVSLYALNGRLLFQKAGIRSINLARLSGDPMMLEVTRNGRSVLRTLVERK